MNRACLFSWVLAVAQMGFAAAGEKVIFEERFDGDKMDAAWTWLRENPGNRRLKDNALEIRVEPGVANTVKNALVRPAPDRTKGKFAVEVTITSLTTPTQQYEQAGITLYVGDKASFKFVKERIDGQLYVFPGKKPMDSPSVQLRVVLSANRFVAQFRPEGKGEFQTAAEGPLPAPANDRISIQCYNGPPDAEHWIRFDDFRILELTE